MYGKSNIYCKSVSVNVSACDLRICYRLKHRSTTSSLRTFILYKHAGKSLRICVCV